MAHPSEAEIRYCPKPPTSERAKSHKGFEFPMHLVMLARNGALVAVRYVEDDDGEVQAGAIAGHSEEGKFVSPIHVMAHCLKHMPERWLNSGIVQPPSRQPR